MKERKLEVQEKKMRKHPQWERMRNRDKTPTREQGEYSPLEPMEIFYLMEAI